MGTNDSSFNDGTGIADDKIHSRHIDWASTGAISGDTGGIWWEEIGRTTLGGTADTISVTPISARKYLQVRISVLPSGQINARMQFNGDTGNNYSERTSTNGAADGTAVSSANIGLSATASTNPKFALVDIINILAQEKLVTGEVVEVSTAGAANAPARAELTSKWANTAAQITRVDVINTGTGDFASGSEVVVLGHN